MILTIAVVSIFHVTKDSCLEPNLLVIATTMTTTHMISSAHTVTIAISISIITNLIKSDITILTYLNFNICYHQFSAVTTNIASHIISPSSYLLYHLL